MELERRWRVGEEGDSKLFRGFLFFFLVKWPGYGNFTLVQLWTRENGGGKAAG